MKKLASILLISNLIFVNLMPIAYAQDETTPTAEVVTPIAEPTSEPTPEATAEPTLEATVEPDESLSPNSDQISQDTINSIETLSVEPEVFESSARIRAQVRIRNLSKSNFRADEKLTVIVDNTASSDTTIKIFNVDGGEVPVVIEVVNAVDPTVLSISPNFQFKAGSYRLEVTDPNGNVSTQDFTWGVLAVNTNKTVYLPNETAKIDIAVLDETGIMVCDANVKLQITNDKLQINEEFTTDNGKIKVNPECLVKDFTLTPDYEASYVVGGVGIYDMKLTAETENGVYSIIDAFEVRDNVSMDVERETATRLFPPETYPVTLNITANEDFKGIISEKVPAIFAITPLSGTVATTSVEESSQPVLGSLIPDIPQLGLPLEEAYPISQTFGSPPDDPILADKYTQFGIVGHDGVDFAAPEGVTVLSVDDGEVIYVNENGEYGKMVVIKHSWGLSYYGHLSQITTVEGSIRPRGHPIGMVGSTGLATGPHLHLGIKPNDFDENNGYKGKINPLPYLGLVQNLEGGGSYFIGTPSDGSAFTTLNWNVDVKKGDKIILGYNFKVPNISPQFYNIGPLEFRNSDSRLVFTEIRQWQLAVDADGSGTNSVNPSFSIVSQADNIYTFTFTASATMDSGGIAITVPAGWSAPQGSAGTAGYTTITATGNATIGTVFNALDSATGWVEIGGTDACQSGPQADTGVKQEGTGSINCNDTTSGSNGPDNGDGIAFTFSATDWSTYDQLGFWIRTEDANSASDFNYNINDGADCTTTPIVSTASSSLSAVTWTYVKMTLSGTRTSVTRFCVLAATAGTLDNDQLWLDEILLGPGIPIFSGSGPWTINARILDAASTETLVVTYGSGGGTSGVDNPSTAGAHTFTTQSRELVTGTLTNISASPVIHLVPSMTNLMRHGNWFNSSGVEQYFVW